MKRRYFILIFLSAIMGIGLYFWIRETGIYYDFRSFDHYKEAAVHNAPAKQLPFKPFEKREESAVQFFAVGCAGSGNKGQKMLAESMAKVAAVYRPDFILYLGDNFYGRGLDSINDPQWQNKFEQIYDPKILSMPFYAVLGNHDYFRNPEAQIAYSEKSSRWRMPARYYSFQHSLASGTQIEFYALDTVMLLSGKGKNQLKWLEENLKSSKAAWKIVYGHHPVHSGAYTYLKQIRKMQQLLEPVLIRYKVDLYLSAHNHSIEVFKEISGVTYIVSGAGSRPRNVRWTDQTNFAYADIGFAWFRIFEREMEFYVVGHDGQIVFNLRIIK